MILWLEAMSFVCKRCLKLFITSQDCSREWQKQHRGAQENIRNRMKIENGRFAKCKYFAHAMVNNTDLLMVMQSGILFVTKGTFGQLTCEWQYSFDEFMKEPVIVSGRRLRIDAKERVKSVFHAKEFGKIINFKTPEDAKWILSKLEEVRDLHSKS